MIESSESAKQTAGGIVLFEVEMIGWLPEAITPALFKRYQLLLTSALAERGYLDIVLGSATTRECLEVRITTPPLGSVGEARDTAIRDVGEILDNLGCHLTSKLQWESVRQLVGTSAPTGGSVGDTGSTQT